VVLSVTHKFMCNNLRNSLGIDVTIRVMQQNMLDWYRQASSKMIW